MDFFEKYKKAIFFTIVILCVIAAVFSINRAKPTIVEQAVGIVITPIQKINTTVFDWIKNKFKVVTSLNDIENENLYLKQQLEEKAELENKVKLLENENKKLSELLNLDLKYSEYDKIAARIIAKDPGNWYDYFVIDKGSNDGLKSNMVVIAAGGLVGRIKECAATYSKVVSIIDDSDAVSAKSLRTDDIGFVRGDLTNSGMCRMEYIDNDAEIIEGDEIVTSHLSEIYPPGITIGYVSEIAADDNALTKYALIKPTVDFKHLETILVINHSYKKEVEN